MRLTRAQKGHKAFWKIFQQTTQEKYFLFLNFRHATLNKKQTYQETPLKLQDQKELIEVATGAIQPRVMDNVVLTKEKKI